VSTKFNVDIHNGLSKLSTRPDLFVLFVISPGALAKANELNKCIRLYCMSDEGKLVLTSFTQPPSAHEDLVVG
jgi:hypothetical protein